MNPLIKNCRTGCHDDILNRTSHYYKILNTKSTIDNRQNRDYLSLLNQSDRNKFTDQHRLSVNLKMIKTIFDIERKDSRYLPIGDSQQPRRKSLKNDYLERQRQLSLSQNNVRLLKNILKVKSDISCDKMNEFNQQVQRYSNLKINPIRHATEMDQQFFNTYRHHLFKTRASPNKHTEDTLNDTIKTKKCPSRKRRHKQTKLSKIEKEELPPTKDINYIKVQS